MLCATQYGLHIFDVTFGLNYELSFVAQSWKATHMNVGLGTNNIFVKFFHFSPMRLSGLSLFARDMFSRFNIAHVLPAGRVWLGFSLSCSRKNPFFSPFHFISFPFPPSYNSILCVVKKMKLKFTSCVSTQFKCEHTFIWTWRWRCAENQ